MYCEGVPEYKDTSTLLSKWFLILLENLVGMIVIPLFWLIGGLYLCFLFLIQIRLLF